MPVTGKRGQEGFTMIATMIGLSVIATLVLVAVTAVGSEIDLIRLRPEPEASVPGGEGGYQRLRLQPAHRQRVLVEMHDVPAPNAVNQEGSTAKRRPVPGDSGAELRDRADPGDDGAEHLRPDHHRHRDGEHARVAR